MVAFVFAGAAMVTSGNDFAISGFLGYAAISALLLLAAAGFAILNIKYIFSNQTQWKMLMENHN